MISHYAAKFLRSPIAMCKRIALAKELRFAFPDGPHEPCGIKDIEAVAD